MKNIMTLRKAIDEKRFVIGKDQVVYEPDYEKSKDEMKVIGHKVGEQNHQYFKKKDISWELIEMKNGQLALLGSSSTDQFLTLTGLNGFKSGTAVLNDICKLWSSQKLDLTAKAITENDYKNIPEETAKRVLTNIWLGTHASGKRGGIYRYFAYYVDEQSRVKYVYLYSSNDKILSETMEVRPIVFLPNDILIDVSTGILYKNILEASKAKLNILIEEAEKKPMVEELKLTFGEMKKIINNL